MTKPATSIQVRPEVAELLRTHKPAPAGLKHDFHYQGHNTKGQPLTVTIYQRPQQNKTETAQGRSSSPQDQSDRIRTQHRGTPPLRIRLPTRMARRPTEDTRPNSQWLSVPLSLRGITQLLATLWRKRPTARANWERAYNDAVQQRDWQTCDYMMEEKYPDA